MSSKRKKRRSVDHSSLSPESKRVKVEGGEKKKKIKIQMMTSDEGSDKNNNPIVVSFPGGLPTTLIGSNSNNDLTSSEDKSPPEFMWRLLPSAKKTPLKKKRRGKKEQEIAGENDGRSRIIGRDSNCNYEGTISSSFKKKCIQRICVGVYDKRRGVLQVSLAAGDGAVCALQQFVPKYDEGQSDGLLKDNVERYRALYKEFGSARKKKAINSEQANRIRVEDSEVKDSSTINQLSSAFTNQTGMSESNKEVLKKLNEKEENRMDGVALAYQEARKMLLPSWNEDAEKPSEVYNAREIVGATNWKRLSHQTKLMLRNVPDKEEWYDTLTSPSLRFKWHDCMKSHVLENILSSPNKATFDSITMAQALNHFITFWHRVGLSSRALRGDAQSFAKELRIPIDFTAHCMNSFLTNLGGSGWNARYALGNQDRDKFLVHILLLYLITHVETNKKNVEIMKASTMAPIIRALSKSSLPDAKDSVGKKIDIPALTANLLREAGCSIEKKKKAEEEGDITVQLKLPLTFPKAPKKITRRAK